MGVCYELLALWEPLESMHLATVSSGPTWSCIGCTPYIMSASGVQAPRIRHAREKETSLVPTRYKIQLDGWRRMHGGDTYLCESAVRRRKLLCRLLRRLSTRQECRQVMLRCLLALDLLTEMRSHILTQLRAVQDESGAGFCVWIGAAYVAYGLRPASRNAKT